MDEMIYYDYIVGTEYKKVCYDHNKKIRIDVEAFIKERYDMTLDELDEFIEKYEPERTL